MFKIKSTYLHMTCTLGAYTFLLLFYDKSFSRHGSFENKRPRGLDALLELKTQYTRMF